MFTAHFSTFKRLIYEQLNPPSSTSFFHIWIQTRQYSPHSAPYWSILSKRTPLQISPRWLPFPFLRPSNWNYSSLCPSLQTLRFVRNCSKNFITTTKITCCTVVASLATADGRWQAVSKDLLLIHKDFLYLSRGAGAAASGAVGVRLAGVPSRAAALTWEAEGMKFYIWETVWVGKLVR